MHNAHPRAHVRRYGASLIEALIATVVLLVAVAALSSQVMIGIRAANRARLHAVACTIAQSVLAEQLALPTLGSSSPIRVSNFSGWMAQVRVDSLNDPRSSFDRDAESKLCLVSVTAWETGRNERLSKFTVSQIVRRPIAASADLSSMADLR